jgi:hypothetical protein
MAMVFCEDCGEKVSKDATACPHCGRSRGEAKPAAGWLSAFTKEHGALVTYLTLVGAIITFFYHWHVDLDQARLSQATTTRESKKAFLEFQLDTYKSVLTNISKLYTMYMLQDIKKNVPSAKVFGPDPGVDEGELIRSFIAEFDTEMAVVEDRRTEFAMGILNHAILAHQHAPWLPHVDAEKCSMYEATQVLSHCMKMSIAESWNLPANDRRETSRPKDDFCNLERATHFADVCEVPLSTEARDEFRNVTATDLRDAKDIPPSKPL